MRRAMMAAAAMLVGATALQAQGRTAPATPATPAHPAAGAPIRVQMKVVGSRYMFEPANFTVHVGDVVEFVNVSGFPHNVQFEATKIPAGAAEVLNRGMTQRLGPLQGPMMTQANQTYRVSFAGAPVGTYDYFCLPHKALGMTGRITVQAR
jgi:plastocyanin